MGATPNGGHDVQCRHLDQILLDIAGAGDKILLCEGGVEKTAKEFNKEFLGKIPLHQDLRISADKGTPLTLSDPQHEMSLIFKDVAKKITDKFI